MPKLKSVLGALTEATFSGLFTYTQKDKAVEALRLVLKLHKDDLTDDVKVNVAAGIGMLHAANYAAAVACAQAAVGDSQTFPGGIAKVQHRNLVDALDSADRLATTS